MDVSSLKESCLYGLAAFGATLFVQVLHPLDVLKTRFQSHDGLKNRNVIPQYNGIINALLMIYKTEGIKGLYKGVFASLSAQTSARVLFFTMYEKRKNKNKINYKNWNVVKSATEAAMFAGTITQPIFTIKTRLMLNTKNLSGFENFRKVTHEIYSQHGLRGFFRGLSLSFILSIHEIIHITLYEKFKIYYKIFGDSNFHTRFGPLICGVSSKFIATVSLYPLTTVRTRIQQNQFYCHLTNEETLKNAKYNNIIECFHKIWLLEGVHGFYKGLLVNLIRTAPAKGIFFFFYEIIKDLLGLKNLEERPTNFSTHI